MRFGKIFVIKMRGMRIDSSCIQSLVLLILVLILGSSRPVWCVDGDDYSNTGNPTAIPLVTSFIYSQISNLTKIFNKEITNSLGYCIKDV